MKTKTSSLPLRTNLVDALSSAIQRRVLTFLFGQPERSFLATRLIGLVGAGSGTVQRELADQGTRVPIGIHLAGA